jgi:hypothetical protein
LPVGVWSLQARHIGQFWRGLVAGQESPAAGIRRVTNLAPAISMSREMPPPVR